MEIRWLEDFIALAKTRHFSRAADEQNVTQPTFSRRIKLLEEEMGVQLVDRNTLPLSLTPAGELFLDAADKITRILRDTREECHAIREEQSSRLVFATTQTLYLSFYKAWLEPFSRSLDIALDLNLHSTAWTVRDFSHALMEQQCDIMLCYWHPSIELLADASPNVFEYVKIASERLLPCSSVDESGAPKFVLPGHKRRPIPFIDYHDNAFLKPVVHHTITHAQNDLHLVTVNKNFHSVSVKAMIREGFGVGWIPFRLAQESIRYGRMKPAGDERYYTDLEVRFYRKRDNKHPSLEKLWNKLKEHTEANVSVV
ncbi:LysR family transcriptional regulator [Hahella sp. KA22]|uniref:LysR family transcriptional regulator n=1 Tax=Hahella sp. KA22 TaxID=1628392 RepID=UPI000FDEC5F6|nr:LysR family transcriptional regulator [Hahella sp. KA22]AZZ93653.1 LysR family transcriptional regulator [Hahella sp. KA22]QAY57028.1 LysR family transcriptional regulator [Hahella sp. KA22]